MPCTKTKRHPRRKYTPRVHHIMLHVRPVPGSRNQRAGGAYIACWVNYPDYEGALVLAKHYLRRWGWRFVKVEQHFMTSRTQYLKHPSLQYYDEAAADGASFVVHSYPRVRKKSGANNTLQRTRGE